MKNFKRTLYRIVKQILILLLFLAFFLTSCGFPKSILDTHSHWQMDYTLNSEHRFIDEKAELLMTAIKNKDVSSIKNMFSQKAQSNDSDLNEKIQLLISIIDEDFDGWIGYNGGSDGSNSNGIQKSIVSYLFKNDNLGLKMWMHYYRTNDEDPSEIGIISLSIDVNGEISQSNTLYWIYNIDSSDYGVYISEQIMADLKNQ